MRVRGAEGGRWRAAWLAVFLVGWMNIRRYSCSIGYRVVAVHLHLPRLSDGHNHRTAPQSARNQITHTVFHVIEPAATSERRRKKKRKNLAIVALSFCLLSFFFLQISSRTFNNIANPLAHQCNLSVYSIVELPSSRFSTAYP